MTLHKQEAYPLAWPQDWPRTRPSDQRSMTAWKKTANQYREALLKELERMGSPLAVISCSVPLNVRGIMTAGIEPRDVGVAVYFSRKTKEDFSWQDGLQLADAYPTDEQVNAAYRRLAQQYHPDRGGDATMFAAVTKHRDAALRWLHRHEQPHDHVIAADQFREVRWNLAAIMLTIRAIRQIERCGTSSLLDRAFKGFEALPAYAGAATVSA